MDIDLVVPWVDGEDIEHIKLKNKYKIILGEEIKGEAINDARFKDTGELKYFFRSIEQNVKFIRYIFLITNGQIPKWLNIKHPKIKIITHDKIMPKAALPTFNSSAIETCIANIPGLSDRFLYANDDFFVAKPINENFFFTKSGYPISRLIPNFHTEQKNIYGKKIMFTINLFYKRFHKKINLTEHHNIDAFYKPDVLNCIKEFKEDFNRTCASKFRAENNISKHIWSLYSFYIGHSKIKGYYFSQIIILFMTVIKKINKIFNTRNRKISIDKSNITNNIAYRGNSFSTKLKTLVYRFVLESAKFSNKEQYNIKFIKLFCINDSQFATDKDRERSINFLNKLFPNKSSFEI